MTINEMFNELDDKERDTFIVTLKYRYDFEEYYTIENHILEYDSLDDSYVWLNDWYEGQTDVEVLGYMLLGDVDTTKLLTCEDCISREEAIENFASWYGYDYDNQGYYRLLKQMPSVTPKFTDEEIQKMQELEQAQLEKAYELGMQISFEEWLSSFNTDSATECFTAVQQLKEKLNGQMD